MQQPAGLLSICSELSALSSCEKYPFQIKSLFQWTEYLPFFNKAFIVKYFYLTTGFHLREIDSQLLP